MSDGHNAASAVAHHHAAVGCETCTADVSVTSSCHNSPLVRHFGAKPHAQVSTLRDQFYYTWISGKCKRKFFL